MHSNILTFVYKAINKLSPSCFHNYFTPNSSVHRIETHQATRGDLFKSLKTPFSVVFKQSSTFGAKLWNTLPVFIRVASSVPLCWCLTENLLCGLVLNMFRDFRSLSKSSILSFQYIWLFAILKKVFGFFFTVGTLSWLVSLFREFLLSQLILNIIL